MRISSWHIKHVDIITAKTTIRLWHELHYIQKKPHDFEILISPEKKPSHLYFAAVKYDEIRALALCERNKQNDLYLSLIAYPPEYHDSPVALISMIKDLNISIDFKKFRSQTRLYYEALLLTEI